MCQHTPDFFHLIPIIIKFVLVLRTANINIVITISQVAATKTGLKVDVNRHRMQNDILTRGRSLHNIVVVQIGQQRFVVDRQGHVVGAFGVQNENWYVEINVRRIGRHHLKCVTARWRLFLQRHIWS